MRCWPLLITFCLVSICRAGSQYTAADVDRALEDARRYATEGKYAKALERHVWYHKNALRYSPGHYGVRLSFALSDWTELNKHYPKAKKALQQIRDETLTQYRRKPSDELLYNEVMSIDFALEDLKSAKALFLAGRRAGFRDNMLLQLPEIIDSGDLQWARMAVGTPQKTLASLISDRKRMLELEAFAGTKSVRSAHDDLFEARTSMLIWATSKTHSLAEAKRVQKEALKVLNVERIRDALKAKPQP